MRARLPKFAAALCAGFALASAPVALVSTAVSPVVAEANGPYHWYDTGEATPAT